MEFINELRLGIKSFLLQRNPGRTALIFDIIQIASALEKNRKSVEALEAQLSKNLGFKEMWEAKWAPPNLSLEILQKMPSDSLGRAYLQHLQLNRLSLDFYKKPDIRRLVDYLSFRLYNVHDIWHVLLGYGVSIIGELEIQAFTLGQMPSPASLFLISGGLYNVVRNVPEDSGIAFERVNQAYQRGKATPFLLSAPIEERLHEKLSKLRSDLLVT